ncbi:MAG: tRNA (guanosine(37)-N1)-methyltransferase TrmD [Phascolarctobacterium sp.]|nr:tRNA (guanosine(37)-N1)-methyltransferase TrmD [Phascolarctobacterium sp.]
MRFLFITLFPEQIEQAVSHSIIKRAADRGLLEINCINPRDFTSDKHRTVDDVPFGGGTGMVLKPEPMVAAIRKAKEQLPAAKVIAMCPGGKTLKQKHAEEYAQKGQDIILLCGHYEGFDERIFSFVDDKISIGDYVLTGGELPALILLDAVSRFIPGVLGKMESAANDSFSTGFLEYPQYTRPVDFEGMTVPEILRNGNHSLIKRWRRKESLKATYLLRPDLLPAEIIAAIEGDVPQNMSKDEKKFYAELRMEISEILGDDK